ncbi:hypothetical protein QBC32DRAFT_345699 [Pseudoneurospora amorphoporcata]|uniref:DUF6604 domain-containing protein n=1 Tax=Pseudoneurospora amorphoporcata TaxID=241081 RepID=A0AAN6NRY5_9PEZI|nr:hypothetical protein QBC32DRAFT_345699 [Pseudoneurospora amorphoporcata]
MAPTRNSYLAYKRDTSYLIYWIVQTSNSIIKSLAASDSPLDGIDGAPMLPLTSAGITVAGLISLSKFVGKHINNVPSTILALFQSVIEARTAAHAAFQQMTARTPDPDVEKSNASHKRFIDALKESFDALGGQNWKPDSSFDEAGFLADTEHAKEELDRLLANRFGALEIHGSAEANDASDQEGPQEVDINLPRQRKQAKPGKGKKGKKGKAKKSSKAKAAPPKEESLEGVPLESYRIIQDQDGIITDYLMAVYDLLKQCMILRSYLQSIWREVAYEGLNSAVAGALSHIAIAMIQRSAAEMFVDFPDHDSYETVMNTITRGDVDKAQGMFTISLMTFEPGNKTLASKEDQAVDIKEHFLIHAYRDLLDFVTDFQKTRAGKPTKRMLEEIRNWDPNFDLRHATKEERIRWRRSYTINWLYDLVNVFSSIVVQRNNQRGEKHLYEKVDWSPKGPWHRHRRLYGLNEFAGFVTSLAMQKPGTDVRDRILPHHVFQLQCIVDSLTVTRGWAHHIFKGDIVVAPPPSYRFRPRRDVDLFLDREVTRDGRGILQAFDVLKQLFERDGALHGDMRRHENNHQILEGFHLDYIDWLGESKYMYGLNTIPPSRFSHVNPNGLWEYSPFLCGVGLEEGLELAYISGMMLWDHIPEPMMLLHLHNMLVQEGYINKPIGLFATLQELFAECFFPDGKPPTANYDKALKAMVDRRGSPRERQRVRNAAASAADIHEIMSPGVNDFFRKKSTLVILREAGWNIDRIPDTDVAFPSVLGMLRLAHTKHITDPVTGKKRIDETDITKRAKAQGMSEENMFQMTKTIEKVRAENIRKANEIPHERVANAMAPGYSHAYLDRPDSRSTRKVRMAAKGEYVDFADRDMLDFMKMDIQADISGERPLSALNFLWTAMFFYMTFMRIEDELEKKRNPLWVRAYKEALGPAAKQKRMTVTLLAMVEQDRECLKVMADVFTSPRAGFLQFIYWDDIEFAAEKLAKDPRPNKSFRSGGTSGPVAPDMDQCSVM